MNSNNDQDTSTLTAAEPTTTMNLPHESEKSGRGFAVPKTLAALADPTRASIFERLAAGPRSVGEIAHGMPVSRPAVSQHLRVLEEAQFVTHQRDGTKHIYRVNLSGLTAIREWLEQFPLSDQPSGESGSHPDSHEEPHT